MEETKDELSEGTDGDLFSNADLKPADCAASD